MPAGAEAALNEMKAEAARPVIFIGVPNLVDTVSPLSSMLLHYFSDQRFKSYFHQPAEMRHHDYARNQTVQAFLKTDARFLLFIDSDVEPNPRLLEMAYRDKPIMSGIVPCWMKGSLMPSVWQQSACEECAVVKHFFESGTNKDPVRYRIVVEEEITVLQRWNPYRMQFEAFRAHGVDLSEKLKCRCRGTGKDPWTYTVHPGAFQKEPFSCDSNGTAALMIRRDVIESMPRPWFKFLYAEDGQIIQTEDHYFHAKAMAMGIQPWCDPAMVCGHFKRVNLLDVNAALQMAVKLSAEQERKKMAAELEKSDPVFEPAFLESAS